MNTSIEGMKRTAWCGELRAADAEKEVIVNGWCERTRDNGGVLFLLLRDRTGGIRRKLDGVGTIGVFGCGLAGDNSI